MLIGNTSPEFLGCVHLLQCMLNCYDSSSGAISWRTWFHYIFKLVIITSILSAANCEFASEIRISRTNATHQKTPISLALLSIHPCFLPVLWWTWSPSKMQYIGWGLSISWICPIVHILSLPMWCVLSSLIFALQYCFAMLYKLLEEAHLLAVMK